MRREECFDRIEQVVHHYHTAVQTVRVLIRLAEDQPKYLHDYQLDLREMRALPQELHDVYFARMFACFESDLRDFWRTTVRDTKPLTEQLLSAIAARRQIPQDPLDKVQRIREFRNHLIHGEQEFTESFTIDEAKAHINAYFAWLPVRW
jgi:hypothetical protein